MPISSIDSEKSSVYEPGPLKADEEVAPTPAPAVIYPEGGLRGWLVVLGVWAVMFFTFGYINTFGIYETYYLETFLKNRSPSAVSWIGSLQVLLQFSGGLLGGPITDRFGPRVIVWPCSIIYVASVMITSLCKEYYQFILTQGVLGGLANGLAYAPAVAVLGQYFHKKRALAMGIASSGSSLGGIIFPIMLNRLLNKSTVGFPWTVRALGFLVLGLVLLACATIAPRFPPRKGSYLLLSAFKTPAYSIQVAGMFLVWLGLFTPFFYLPDYSQDHGMTAELSFYTIPILNAGSLLGRLLSGLLSPRLGNFNLLFATTAISGLLILCWIHMISTASIIVFAALYGFFSGFVIALFPTTLAHIATHPTQIGSYIGMALGLYGIAGLTGTPITGAMIAKYGGYTEALVFSGVVVLAGSGLVLCARFSLAGRGVVVV